MSHENAALVINQFLEIYKDTGREPKVWDPSRVAIIFDHRVPAESPKTATNQKKVREFVARHTISKFHDIRGDDGGICHQILPESGYVRPGAVVVGTDSHTTSHGALGAFCVRHRRDGNGQRLDARRGGQHRGPRHDQGGGPGDIQAVRRAEGPDPPSDRHG